MSALPEQILPPEGQHQAIILLPTISETKGPSLLEQAQSVRITDQPTYDVAAEMFKAASDMEREIVADYAKPKADAHQAHKSVCDLEKKHLAPVQEAKKVLSRSIGAWDEEQERLRREEQRRLEEEARKRAEEEALASAIDAEQSGADAEEIEAVLSSPMPIQKVTAAPTYSKQVPTRENWSAEVVSLRELVKAAAANPAFLCYLQANESALGAAARSQKNVFNVPGCKAVVQRTAIRGR